MSALDLTARGLAVQALAPWRTGPFAALAGAAIPPGVLHLHTSGHHAAGKGYEGSGDGGAGATADG